MINSVVRSLLIDYPYKKINRRKFIVSLRLNIRLIILLSIVL